MKGEFKLAKAANGVCHFADIEIELQKIDRKVEPDLSEVEILFSSWVSAAKSGVYDALDLIGEDEFKLVKINRLIGTASDTTDHEVWLVALMSVLVAFELDDDFVSFSHQVDHWVVETEIGKSLSSKLMDSGAH